MSKCIAIVVVLIGVPAVGTPALAEGPSLSCSDTVDWSGELDAVELARAATEAALADLPGALCENVSVHVEGADAGLRVEVTRGDQHITHVVADPTTLPTWLESWLAPSLDALDERDHADAATPPTHVPRATVEPVDSAPPHHAPSGKSSAATETDSDSEARWSIPILLALRVIGDADHIAWAWMGAEGEVAIAFGPSVWAGLSVAGVWSPKQRAVERRGLRLSARAGWRVRWSDVLFRLGAGAGLASASARETLANGDLRVDDDSGPFVEIATGLDFDLGGVALSIELDVRAHIPDDIGDPPEPEDLLDPVALPVVAATLGVGLAFELGGGW